MVNYPLSMSHGTPSSPKTLGWGIVIQRTASSQDCWNKTVQPVYQFAHTISLIHLSYFPGTIMRCNPQRLHHAEMFHTFQT